MPRPRPSDAAVRQQNRERTLKVMCWCKCSTVELSAADVRAGLTKTCGRRMCNALEFTAILGSASGEPCDCKER